MIFSNDCYIKAGCKKFKEGTCLPNSFCKFLFKLNYLFDKSLLTDTQRKPFKLLLDSDGTDELSYSMLNELKLNIVSKVDSGTNLYIYSTIPGNGKTSWAIKLLQSYLYAIAPVSDLKCKALFVSVPKYLLELKSNISEKSEYVSYLNHNVLDADLVVWDDIATKSASDFEHEHLLSLIDSRINARKSNIFTSNISPNDLYTLLGTRLASRIINTANTVQFAGQDKRGLVVE